MKTLLLFVVLLILISGSTAASLHLEGTVRGQEDYAAYLLQRGDEFWQDLRSLFRVRPSTPYSIIFYDGRADFIQNKPHPTAPESLRAMILYNRIHLVLEKREPFLNEKALYHELVHIFQSEFYSLTPSRVWFSDIQSEYLVGLFFFGPAYHNHLRQNLTFNPREIISRLNRDLNWRYNRSLGVVVMDYLLDHYQLTPRQMDQLIWNMQADGLLHNHQQVITAALNFAAGEEKLYSFAVPLDYPTLPSASALIPSPWTFSRKQDQFFFHAFSLEGSFHNLGIWNPAENTFSPFLISKDYLDWPALGSGDQIFFIGRSQKMYQVIQGSTTGEEQTILFEAPEYLGHLHYDPGQKHLYWTLDQGPHRHLYSLDLEQDEPTALTTGPHQDWSPFTDEDGNLYFLSNRNNPEGIGGGDLFLYREQQPLGLTSGLQLEKIVDGDPEQLLIKKRNPASAARGLGTFNLKDHNWEQIISPLPLKPYFPHLQQGQIQFWQTPFNTSP